MKVCAGLCILAGREEVDAELNPIQQVQRILLKGALDMLTSFFHPADLKQVECAIHVHNVAAIGSLAMANRNARSTSFQSKSYVLAVMASSA